MLLVALLLISSTAFADEEIAQQRTRLWPATVGIQALVGGEFHSPRGNPVAMGVGGEFFWKGRVGGFASLLASQGTQVVVSNGQALGDRISLPLGFVARPFAFLAAVDSQSAWWQRAVASIGVQLGVSMEHIRSPVDPNCQTCSFEATQAAFHLGISAEIPVWHGPLDGGVALRLQGRLIAGGDTTLNVDPSKPLAGQKAVFEPGTSGQLFAGLVWYP